MASSVDVVLLVYDQIEYTKTCIESIIKNTDYPYRLVIIDNGSLSPQTKQYLQDIKVDFKNRIVLLRNEINQGFVKAVNQGLDFSRQEEFSCIISNDTLVYPGWLSEMVAVAEKDSSIGLVNPLWELPKRFRVTKEDYFNRVVFHQKGQYIETDWARGFCFLLKRQVVEKIGGLDEAFAPAYYDDWDFSLRAIQAGFIIVRALGAFVWHFRNITYEQILGKKGLNEQLEQKKIIFESRWGRFKKVLLVIDKSLKNRTKDLQNAAIYLLRQQTRIVVLIGNTNFSVRHTNCFLKVIPDWFLKISVLFYLLRNSLGSANKRYDYVICSEQIKSFLDKFGFVRERFILKKIADLFRGNSLASEKRLDENYPPTRPRSC